MKPMKKKLSSMMTGELIIPPIFAAVSWTRPDA